MNYKSKQLLEVQTCLQAHKEGRSAVRSEAGGCSSPSSPFNQSLRFGYWLVSVLHPSGKSFLFLQVGCFLSAALFNRQDVLLCKEDCRPHTALVPAGEGAATFLQQLALPKRAGRDW